MTEGKKFQDMSRDLMPQIEGEPFELLICGCIEAIEEAYKYEGEL